MHNIPLSPEMLTLPIGHWGRYATLRENTLAYVDFWTKQPWLRFAEPSPQLTRLVAWLVDNAPEDDGRLCLLHVDFGPHNILVHEEKVSAILDWESSRIGDPAEDIAWFLQSSNGRIDFRQVLDWYEADTGQRISEFRLRYFDVVGCLKQMVANLSIAAMFDRLETASVEWANFPLRWFTYITPFLEGKITAAEKSRL